MTNGVTRRLGGGGEDKGRERGGATSTMVLGKEGPWTGFALVIPKEGGLQ
jgi:hypothetical protein